MASTATLLKIFGGYVISAGLGMSFMPARFSDIFAMLLKPTTLPAPVLNEETSSLLGPIVTALGIYYYTAGVDNNTAFARSSVSGRYIFATLLAIQWYRGVIPSGGAVALAGVDIIFAYLTSQALAREGKK